MGLFIFMCLLGLVGIALWVVNRFVRVDPDARSSEADDTRLVKRGLKVVGTLLLVIALTVVGFNSYTIVPARNLAIPIVAGQPGDVMDNGFHPIEPWATVETFDATVQIVSIEQVVRLGNGGTATVDASIQWQLDPAKNNFLVIYRQYRTFDAIQEKAIKRNLQSSLNDVFEHFDPLATIDSNGQVAVQMSDLKQQLLTEMDAVGITGVLLKNPIILPPKYSDKVEEQIDNIIKATAATRIAEQQKKTAQLIKDSNDLLASGNLSPGVLYQNCLNLLEKMGSNLPPAMSCGTPGANVVIASAK